MMAALPYPMLLRLLCLNLLASVAASAAQIVPPGKTVTVFIVAGQSNMLNWHAAAGALPADPRDPQVLFYHVTGAPPDKGLAVPVNASSRGEWIALGPQEQDPFVKYERRFFGPEITLARNLAGPVGTTPVAVIKIGYFGSNLAADWRPGATGGNRLYRTLLTEIERALRKLAAQGRPGVLAGFFWMQGETDANRADHADAYAANLEDFIGRVREDLSAPSLPFVLGRIGPPPPKGYEFQNQVRRAQTSVAARVAATAWVDTDDLPRDTDHVHLLAEGVLRLGERWADAWRHLQRSPPDASNPRSPSGSHP